MPKNKEKDYVQEILAQFLKKYYVREVKHQEINTRRIILKVGEVYRDYEKNNSDLQLKVQINEAVQKLEALQFISVDYLLYSDDVIKMYLNENMIKNIQGYMEINYGITARHYLLEEIRKLIKEYRNKGEITYFYCEKLNHLIENSAAEVDINKEREILKMLAFIQNNEKDFYVREVSMMVYGSSKYFEEYRYDGICNIIREADRSLLTEHGNNDEILRQYHISAVEQEIFIKGDYTIELDNYTLETKHFYGGISLSSKDIQQIKRITVNTGNIITIENKTAFYRFVQNDYSTIYLGGYANRHQIVFLKRLYEDNSNLTYFHFGDIDVGGFLIHQHLCNTTGVQFKLFCMGVRELNAPEYKECLVKLTDNDIERIASLKNNSLYKEVIVEMLNKNAKLEQEIICFTIMEHLCSSGQS